MPKKVNPIPKGYHMVTPYLVVQGGKQAIAFYKKVFGAKLRMKLDAPGGTIGHAELEIGDSVVMLADEFPAMGFRAPRTIGGTPVSLMHYVKSADSTFKKAVAAGAKVLRPLENQFYGDRSGTVEDPFGHVWTIGSHVEDVPPKEMARRAKAMAATSQPG